MVEAQLIEDVFVCCSARTANGAHSPLATPLALAPRFRFERSSPAVVVLPPRAQISIK